MAFKFRQFVKGILTRGVSADPSDNLDGSLWYNSSDGFFKGYINGAIRGIIDQTSTQNMTNKGIDADNNTISNLETDNLKAGVLVTDLSTATLDTELASALAIKTVTDTIDDKLDKISTESNDNRLVRTDGDGDTLQGSGVTLDDSDAISGLSQADIGNTEITSGQVSTSSGDLTLDSTDGTTIVDDILQLNEYSKHIATTDNTTTGADATLDTGSNPVIRLTNASLTSIAGLSTYEAGKLIIVINATGGVVTVGNEDTDASAADRVITGTSKPVELKDGASLWFYRDDTSSRWRIIGGSGAGEGTGLTKVDYHDPVSTVLPTGATVTIDGQSGVNGDRVLFSNLSSDNNKVYTLSGVGSSIAWESTLDFNLGDPEDGDTVIVTSGDSFAEQLGKFDGTNWKFNDVVRYFSGADYWEQSSLKTSSIADNTTDSIFEVALANNENFVIDYSILRGSTTETGMFVITSDGTSVDSANYSANIGATGVELSADNNSGTLRFRYTSDSSGVGSIKYFTKRWSNASGGPGGVPSYSGSSSSSIAAAGSTNDIQYRGSGGNLAGDSNFQWDSSNKTVTIGDLEVQGIDGSVTISDNTSSPANLFVLDSTTISYAIIEYSIARGGQNRVGRLLVCHNGTTASLTEESTDTGGAGISDTDIVISANLSAPNLQIRYTSNNTGNDGTFKYSVRKWS